MINQNEARAGASGAGLDDAVEAANGSTESIIADRADRYHPGALTAALRYARRGLAVFPLRPGTKVPYPGSRGCLDATSDVERVARDWPAPDANVGVATGRASGVWVLDVDPRHGGDVALAQLIARHGPLPATAEAATASGGRHLYWRWPADGPQGRGRGNLTGLSLATLPYNPSL